MAGVMSAHWRRIRLGTASQDIPGDVLGDVDKKITHAQKAFQIYDGF